MARLYSMNFEGHPWNRWVKMYKGVRYRVSCQDLGAMACTQEASYKLANDWWRKKLADLEGVPSRVDTLVKYLTPSREEVEREGAFQTILNEIAAVPKSERHHVIAHMTEIDTLKPGQAVEKDRTLKVNAERWLDVIRGEVQPTSYREIKEFARWFYVLPLAGENVDLNDINEDKVEEFFLYLRRCTLAQSTKKKRWSFFRCLVTYFWSRKLIDLPRNLDSFSFTVEASAIKVYDVADVRSCLSSLKPRLRLYALLGLNCSMTNVNVGKLRQDMVDLDAGTLTRKRVKTAKKANVPVVTYKLWPETLALLKRFKADHPTLMLTSKDNTSLYDSRQEGDQTPKKDLVSKQWKKKRLPLPFKAFRSIGATLVESHPIYGRYTSYYLGHSPKSIKDINYAAPSDELFGEAMEWLRTKILGD